MLIATITKPKICVVLKLYAKFVFKIIDKNNNKKNKNNELSLLKKYDLKSK